MTLADAYAVLKSGSLWSSTGKCKGYAASNPGEAAQIDAYVAALNAGQTVAPPALSTATGRGLVGMLAALAPNVPPPPFSPTRFVWTLGDPAWNTGDGKNGWWANFPNISSTGWIRDAAGADPVLSLSRVGWDDSEFPNLMASVTGSYGDSPGSGPCRTCRVEINPADPTVGAILSGAQASVLRLDDSQEHNPAYGVRPSVHPVEGETWFYGWAMATDPGYKPHGWDGHDLVFGNFNSFGLEQHGTISVLGPIHPHVANIWPANSAERIAGPNGGVWWKRMGNPSVMIPGGPRLGLEITAGLNDTATDDATHTCRGFVGPPFVAGRAYKCVYMVTWSARQAGALKWWVDDGQGAGYVLYADMAGISTNVHDGAGNIDDLVYPELLNYRKDDSTLPLAKMYYGGFIRGSTMSDVTIP